MRDVALCIGKSDTMKPLGLFISMILVMLFLTSGMSGKDAEAQQVRVFKLGFKEKRQKIFRIYNPGNQTVRINSITPTAECSCSVPIWTTGRIKPGKFGKVMVVFDPGVSGSVEIPLQIYFYNKEDVVDETLTQRVTLMVTLEEPRR